MAAEKLKDMTEGKPLFLIISLAFPLMLGNIFQQLYTVVDTMVVGKVLGVNALAALGVADCLNWMMLGIITGFTQGFSIHIAQEFGSKNIEGLKETVGVSAKLALEIAIFLLIGSQIGAKFILLNYHELVSINFILAIYLSGCITRAGKYYSSYVIRICRVFYAYCHSTMAFKINGAKWNILCRG